MAVYTYTKDETIKELREKVALSCRILYKQGLATYMEHVSAKIPGEDMLITNPFGSLKETRPEDLLLVDFDGNLIEGSKQPRGWTLFHIELFKKRNDCKAIVHTHQMLGIVFGMTEREVLSLGHTAAPTSSKDVAIYENPEVIHDWNHAREVVERLGKKDICHIQGHGMEFLGKSVEDATIAAVHFEEQAKINYLANSIGFPKEIPQENLENIKKFHEEDLLERSWDFYSELVTNEEKEENEVKELLQKILQKIDGNY